MTFGKIAGMLALLAFVPAATDAPAQSVYGYTYSADTYLNIDQAEAAQRLENGGAQLSFAYFTFDGNGRPWTTLDYRPYGGLLATASHAPNIFPLPGQSFYKIDVDVPLNGACFNIYADYCRSEAEAIDRMKQHIANIGWCIDPGFPAVGPQLPRVETLDRSSIYPSGGGQWAAHEGGSLNADYKTARFVMHACSGMAETLPPMPTGTKAESVKASCGLTSCDVTYVLKIRDYAYCALGETMGNPAPYCHAMFKQLVTPGGPPKQVDNPCTEVGDPCVAGSGNQFQEERDFQYGHIVFSRYYNSLRELKNYGKLGLGWTHSFTQRVLTDTLTQNHGTPVNQDSVGIATQDERGHAEFFRKVSTGVFRSTVQVGKVLKFTQQFGSPMWEIYHIDGHIERFDQHGRLALVIYPDAPEKNLVMNYRDGLQPTLPRFWKLDRVYDGMGRYVDFKYVEYPVNDWTYPEPMYEVRGSDGSLLVAYDVGFPIPSQPQNTVILNAVWYTPGSPKRNYLYNERDHFVDPSMSMPFHLTGIIDENGKRYADFRYDRRGRAVGSENAGGANKVSLAYVSDGSVTGTQPLGETISFGFRPPATDQTFRKPTSFADGNGKSRTWVSNYEDPACIAVNGNDERRCRVTDRRGMTTAYRYDTFFQTARIEAQGSPEERRIETTYDSTILRPVETRTYIKSNGNDVLESRRAIRYDASRRVAAECEYDPAVQGASGYVCSESTLPPAGVRRWVYTYCPANDPTCVPDRLKSTTDPRGQTTRYEHWMDNATTCTATLRTCHQYGDIRYIVDPANQRVEFAQYDRAGRVTARIDVNGVVTKLQYNARGWLVRSTIVDPDPAFGELATVIEYDGVGNVTKTTQPDGSYIRNVYDDAHRLTDVYDALGNRMHFDLDADGNRIAEKNYDETGTLRQTLSRTYNSLSRLVAATDSRQKATTFEHDDEGNVVMSTDPRGIKTKVAYDGLNRLAESIQNYSATNPAQGARTAYKYDGDGRRATVTDPDGLVTSYEYDAFGQLERLTSPDTGETLYTYDLGGNRATQRDARNVTLSYVHDALGRVTQINHPTPSLDVRFYYDESNAVTGCTSSFPVGRLTRVTDSTGSTRFCYDARGNVVAKTQTADAKTWTTAYAYTRANNLAGLTYPSGAIVTYQRDAAARIVGVQFKANATAPVQTLVSQVKHLPFGPIGQLTFGNGRAQVRTHDQDYRVTSVVGSAPDGMNTYYTYDDAGRVIHRGSGAPFPADEEYDYDDLDRLTGYLESNYGAAYAYNKSGDRTSEVIISGLSNTQLNYTYQPGSHRLASVGGVARSYDGAGNTTSGLTAATHVTGLVYDDRGRLSKVQTNVPGGWNWTYSVNAFGQRVKKARVENVPQATSYFVYDQHGALIGEYDGSGAARMEYIYLDVIPVGLVKGGATLYVESDNVGAPRSIIDPVRNIPVWIWDFARGPFGSGDPYADPDGDGEEFEMNLRFRGQYYDSETRLHYNYFRDYEPATGRYLESDPIGLDGGINTYGYVSARPLLWVDPFGLNGMFGTVVCDGNNGFKVQNSNPTCAKKCTDVHERAHIADFKAKAPMTCYGAKKDVRADSLLFDGMKPERGGAGWTDKQFENFSECNAHREGKKCLDKMRCCDAAKEQSATSAAWLRHYKCDQRYQ